MTLNVKLLVILFAVFFNSSIALSTDLSYQYSYAEQIVNKANNLRIYEERTWEVLLHYAKNYFGYYKSKINDEKFFLSPDGQTNRKSELEANLRSFLIPDSKDGEHAACRFPARFEWLVSRLEIDASRIPAFSCTEMDKGLRSVEAKSAVLVFPVGHINSPASMFGHTLIRIDGNTRSNLISFAANYSADTNDTNGFIYAWKGLTGMYNGYYSMMPYYIKVKEYNDLEHRDMWEYKLKLSETEVGRMVKHLWELQNIQSPYYFLDENCSYNLMFLIEAARPELHLTDKTGVFVLPTHTVKIIQASGIIDSVSYRPSQGTKIRKMSSLLDYKSQKHAYELAMTSKNIETIRTGKETDSQKILVLDLAAGYLQHRFARKEIEKDVYSKLYLSILAERSKLGMSGDSTEGIVEPTRPENGHGTTKISIGGGVRKEKLFTELNIRPTFHGLIDPDQGYLKGAQIKFLDTSLRYNVESDKIQLKTLHILDILSLAPRDMFFSPVSWKVVVGVDSEPMNTGKDSLVYRLGTGAGFSYASPFGGIAYALGEIDLNAGEKIRGSVALGSGFSIGGLEQITDWWKLHLQMKGMWYKLGDDRYSLKASVAQNFRLTENNSLNIEYTEEYVNRHRISEASLSWNYYF